MIPQEADAKFVAGREEILETYAEPADPRVPVVCMDEQPVQLLAETRTPISATKDHPQRIDYEYERAGTASVFVFCEPKSGWRQMTARPRRTKVDWANAVADLMRTRYAQAKKVILVCDNLNTHTGRLLRSLRSDHGSGVGETDRIPLHAETRQLAESRRMRTQCHDPAVLRSPPLRHDRNPPTRNHRLGERDQRQTTRRRLAIPHRRRPTKTQIALSQIMRVMGH